MQKKKTRIIEDLVLLVDTPGVPTKKPEEVRVVLPVMEKLVQLREHELPNLRLRRRADLEDDTPGSGRLDLGTVRDRDIDAL